MSLIKIRKISKNQPNYSAFITASFQTEDERMDTINFIHTNSVMMIYFIIMVVTEKHNEETEMGTGNNMFDIYQWSMLFDQTKRNTDGHT